MGLNIVLVEPEIPQNTGNIARTCAAIGANLHLIEPLGFSIDDRYLKRAGLDYWHLLNVKTYPNIDAFYEQNPDGPYFYASTKADKTYCEVSYPENCYIVFGKETKGLPEELLYKNMHSCIRIPMVSEARSLNLSNSVAIIVYEAMRQHQFAHLLHTGHLTKF